MPEFAYKAMDANGKNFSGILEAENLDEFYRLLKERSQYCVTVRESGARRLSLSLTKPKMKTKELVVFCRQFSAMLNAGITVIKGLDILYQQTENRTMKAKLLDVYEAVQKGESLSMALRKQDGVFPELMVNMIEAGEASGSLDVIMNRLADTYEKENKLQNKVRQSLVYPLFLVVLTILIVAFMMAFVLPKFTAMFAQLGGTVPLPTKILLAVSSFFLHYWYLIAVVLAAAVLAFRKYITSKAGRAKWGRFKLELPVAGKLLLKVESAHFSRILASLISSGLPMIQSLEIVSRITGNAYIENGIFSVIEDVRHGLSLSASVRKIGIFPPMLCSMLSIGEESGTLDEILNKTSAFYDEEAETAIQRLVSLIEPVMIVVLALIVGFIVISIILPIYSIYNQVNGSV